MLIVFLLALFSWFLIEKPVLKYKRNRIPVFCRGNYETSA
jgi:peptidoglycan/LPS O-acetylase OafA/YrhL